MIGHHGMTVLTFITLALPAGRKRTGLLPCFRACLLNGSPLTLDAIKTARFILTLHRWLVPGLALGLAWLCHSAAQEPNAGNVGPEPAVSLVPLAEHGPDPNRWALVGLNTAAAVCFVIWWRWMGRRKGHAAFARTGRSALVRFEPGADDEWKARALAAEARAEKAAALLRSKLMPQVARWMTSCS